MSLALFCVCLLEKPFHILLGELSPSLSLRVWKLQQAAKEEIKHFLVLFPKAVLFLSTRTSASATSHLNEPFAITRCHFLHSFPFKMFSLMEVGGAAAAGLFQLSAAMQLQDLLPPGVPHQDQSAFPRVPASSPQKVLGFVGWGSVVLPPFIQMHHKPPTQLLSISLNTECFSTAFRLMF